MNKKSAQDLTDSDLYSDSVLGQFSGLTPDEKEDIIQDVYPIDWPPEWAKYLRRGVISGRYDGEMTMPRVKICDLDLRIDIDARYKNSPVMGRISGDFYQTYYMQIISMPIRKWRVYLESWIVDDPKVVWNLSSVVISGKVRFWKGSHPTTKLQITIRMAALQPISPITAVFSETGGAARTFSCTKKSDCFRDLKMEIDVCQSTNTPPLTPTYDTHWHNTRPADLPQRVLTIEEAYRETGVSVTIDPTHTVIDDSNPSFTSWSAAELHDAMETNFSQISGAWPNWKMWGLLAGIFENPKVGGIMFDAAAAYGGAGEAPDRQGFAVFRNHSWFTNLVVGTPTNQNQAWAMRHYLYTFVHEAGHAFNLLHSWNKGRPDALSWMNYDWMYDQRNGTDSFWSNFRFRFDDEELIHIRHGDRDSVIMGGDPWASGGHLESTMSLSTTMDGDAPVELRVESKKLFEFMEPVEIELRLRNLLSDQALTLDTRLSPEYGGVLLIIQRPDGRSVEFAPIMCKVGLPDLKVLEPTQASKTGADRYSERIMVSYGTPGFYFDQPGEYLLRAIYQGAGDLLIVSNVHRLRIGNPLTKADDILAQNMFSHEVGLVLSLNGSRSQHLKNGMATLEEVAQSKANTALGTKAAEIVAGSYSRPFYRIEPKGKPKLVLAYKAEPEKALALTDNGVTFYRNQKSKYDNLAYHDLVIKRSQLLVASDKKEAARKEVATLIDDLGKRQVNKVVIDDIKTFQESLK